MELNHEEVITMPELARLLRVSRTLVYQLARKGRLPVLRIGKRILISRKNVDALLATRESTA